MKVKVRILWYATNGQVRVEARKVHDLFFDILKIAFPDNDFREARGAISFSGPASTPTSAPSPRPATAGGQGQGSKRHKQINEVEPDPPPPQKQLIRGAPAGEDMRGKSHISQKESRLGSSSSRDLDDSPLLTHPGDLVISKKKRKDREKSAVKPRSGSSGPVSPPSIGRSIRSPGPGSMQKDGRSNQQAWASQPAQQANGGSSGGGGGSATVGWANPVKRMRTDAGKRRPSHL